ncbi:MAG: DeoR/GlpR transcriptional regulator [Clostridiales bacterium]|nr:DeoR/GlpR transcriptional regulator [Clostridiales bacterium]
MIALERKRYILNALKEKGIINLREIAKELNMAEITIRRDFEKLEAEGKLKRVQGGATIGEDSQNDVSAELTMNRKISVHMKEKELVARYVAKTVKEGECVFIDGGTTMIPLVAELVKKNVHIVTYNTLILEKLANPAAKIFMIGGEYSPYFNMNVGAMAQDMLRQFHFDKSFISCVAANLEQKAAYMAETESLIMKKIAMEQSDNNYLLIDAHKFEANGFLKLCDFSKFDKIYCNEFQTDTALPDNITMVKADI